MERQVRRPNCKKMPELEDVATDQQTGACAVSLVIDRVTASRLGIAPTTIDNTLYDAFGQRADQHPLHAAQPVPRDARSAPAVPAESRQTADQSIFRPTPRPAPPAPAQPLRSPRPASAAAGKQRPHALRCSTRRHRQSSPARTAAITALAARSGHRTTPNTATSNVGANAIPLSAFTHMQATTELLSINHQGQFPSVTVSFNLAPNASLGTAISKIDSLAKKMNFPASAAGRFPGHRRFVPQFAFQRGSPHPRRSGHCLHRARRPV